MTAFQLHNPRIRYSLFALWLLVVVGALYLYFFQREAVQAEMRDAMSASFWAAAIAYLLIGAFRAFTLVPATFPLLVAMPFFDPWVLLALTLPCIAISSNRLHSSTAPTRHSLKSSVTFWWKRTRILRTPRRITIQME